MSTRSRRRLGFMLAMVMTGCATTTVAAPSAAAPAGSPPADAAVIVFGGFGYLEERTQQALYEVLTDPAFDTALAAEAAVVALNEQSHGFPTLSAHPVALYVGDAEAAIARAIGAERAPRDAVAGLQTYFDRTLGLFFVGALEDHSATEYELPGGSNATVYHDYFVTGVSALLIDLQTDEIVLSASALGVLRDESKAAPTTDPADILASYRIAYVNGAEKALERLARLAARTDLAALSARATQHMVTGMWVNGSNARQTFDWTPPAPPPDMCRVPSGCADGAPACTRLAGLMIHGLSDALSERGLAVIPPLAWSDWRRDKAWEVSARFILPQDRHSLTGRLRRIPVDPRQAALKYVVTLDDVGVQSDESEAGVIADHYGANLSLVRAATGAGSCTPADGIEQLDDDAFAGVHVARRGRKQAPPSRDTERAFYTLVILDTLPELAGHLPEGVGP